MDQFQFAYQKTTVAQLPEEAQNLVAIAAKAIEKSYSPYSHFRVGAAVLLDNGEVLTGANHENASFPAGVCAERAVLGNLDMGSGHKVKAMAISYKAEGEHTMPLSPCGLCRQTIMEVQLNQHAPIALYMTGPGGQVIYVEDAGYLLPFYFSNEYLTGE